MSSLVRQLMVAAVKVVALRLNCCERHWSLEVKLSSPKFYSKIDSVIKPAIGDKLCDLDLRCSGVLNWSNPIIVLDKGVNVVPLALKRLFYGELMSFIGGYLLA